MTSPPPLGYPAPPPDHPQATLILVLGVLGLAFCGILAPFAWWKGRNALAEIDASEGRIGGRGLVYAGYVMGIIGTVIIGVSLLIGLVAVVIVVIAALASSSA